MQTLVDSYLALTARPLRTLAMITGILLGVFAAAGAIVIADTQQAQIDRRFDAQRSQFVVLQVTGDDSAGFPAERVARVTSLDVVEAAGQLSIWTDSVIVATNQSTDDEAAAPLIVADPGGLRAGLVDAGAGAPVSLLDNSDLVWLGRGLATRLGLRLDVPQTVTVSGNTYSVAGVVDATDAFGYVNGSVIMGEDAARATFGAPRSLRFLAKVRPGSAAAVGQFAASTLDPQDAMLLTDVTPPDGQLLLGNVASDLRRIGVVLGLLVGIIGMIAVANTLTMAVSQRSREIGLRAAMGWTQRRIAGLILVESAIAGLLAALLGCGLGLATAAVWAAAQGWQLVVEPTLPAVLIVAGTAASVLGGLVPALRAASISPLVAMRS